MRRRPLLLLAVATVTACGGSTPNPFTSRGAAGAPSELRVEVDNRNFNDLRIYAVTTRGPQQMGQVGGHTSRTFRLPWPALDDLRFQLEFLAGEKFVTNAINAAPGDRLVLEIPDNPYNAVLRRR